MRNADKWQQLEVNNVVRKFVRNRERARLAGILSGVLAAAALAAVPAELGFSRSVTPGTITHYVRLFRADARDRLDSWKAFVRGAESRGAAEASAGAEKNLLDPVNNFFNRLPAVTDSAHWGVEDYWATPAESLSSNGADCEDYAIAKYFTLKELGVPISRLRLVYARTWRSRAAHLVLAYYPDPRADPLILDNLDRDIQPSADRPDLIPVYTFNDEDLVWPREGLPTVRASASSNRKWKGVLEKLARELAY